MLYHTESVMLERYSSGDIIVEANTLEEAQEKALLLGRIYLFNYYCDSRFLESPQDYHTYKVKKKEQLLKALKNRPTNWQLVGYKEYLLKVRLLREDVKSLKAIESGGLFIVGSE